MFSSIVGFLPLAIILFAAFLLVRRIADSKSPRFICPHCGTSGQPRKKNKGSLLIEIILWLCFIVPGLIYSIWRLTNRDKVCPSCGMPGMVSVDSPVGRRLTAEFAGKR